ncbi:MAG: hypothetical protein ABIN67_00960 [Ferruginibacter sp.]
MSYDIHLYRAEVKDRHIVSKNDNFFENENNIVPFSQQQFDNLKGRLIRYGYFIENETVRQVSFGFKKDKGTSALLTDNCLSFASGGDGIFEISMTASEFTDTGEYKKYDPQDGGWEEI